MGELPDIIRSIRDEMLLALEMPGLLEVDVSTNPMGPAHEYAGLHRVNVTGPHGDITVHRTVYRSTGDVNSHSPPIDDWQMLLSPEPTSFDVDSI